MVTCNNPSELHGVAPGERQPPRRCQQNELIMPHIKIKLFETHIFKQVHDKSSSLYSREMRGRENKLILHEYASVNGQK